MALHCEVYTGRTAIADATTFIESLANVNDLVELEGWDEADTPTIMVVWKVTGH